MNLHIPSAIMPTTSEQVADADPSSVNDPSDPHHANQDHVSTGNSKPDDFLTVLTDPNFKPTISDAPLLRKIQSFAVLFALVAGGLFLGRTVLRIELLTTGWPVVVGIGVAITAAIVMVAGDIDWWELVLAYWWLAMPAGAAAGLALVVLGEETNGMRDLD